MVQFVAGELEVGADLERGRLGHQHRRARRHRSADPGRRRTSASTSISSRVTGRGRSPQGTQRLGGSGEGVGPDAQPVGVRPAARAPACARRPVHGDRAGQDLRPRQRRRRSTSAGAGAVRTAAGRPPSTPCGASWPSTGRRRAHRSCDAADLDGRRHIGVDSDVLLTVLRPARTHVGRSVVFTAAVRARNRHAGQRSQPTPRSHTCSIDDLGVTRTGRCGRRPRGCRR